MKSKYLDCNGKEIKIGDRVRIVSKKINSLVNEGEIYRVYERNGEILINVGIALSEVSPNFCEVVDEQ